jgi:hypothetical protein
VATASDVSLVISCGAVALSLGAFLTTRWRDRRDLLLRVHQSLIAADQQRGRRSIYTMSANHARVEDLGDADYVLINNALASLNTLGIYYRRRYVRREDVLELWALPVVRLLRAAEPFLDHRDELAGTRTWPQLRAFAVDAEKYLQRQGVDVKAVETHVTELPNPGV